MRHSPIIKTSSLLAIVFIISAAISTPAFAENASSTKPHMPKPNLVKAIITGKIASSTASTTKDKLKIAASSTLANLKEIKKDNASSTKADAIKARKAEIIKEIFLRRHRNDKHATSTLSTDVITATSTASSTLKKK